MLGSMTYLLVFLNQEKGNCLITVISVPKKEVEKCANFLEKMTDDIAATNYI